MLHHINNNNNRRLVTLAEHTSDHGSMLCYTTLLNILYACMWYAEPSRLQYITVLLRKNCADDYQSFVQNPAGQTLNTAQFTLPHTNVQQQHMKLRMHVARSTYITRCTVRYAAVPHF